MILLLMNEGRWSELNDLRWSHYNQDLFLETLLNSFGRVAFGLTGIRILSVFD